MKEYMSKTHRAKISDKGIVEVYLIGEHVIEETSMRRKKLVTERFTASNSPRTVRPLLAVLDSTPVLQLAHAGSGNYHMDVEWGLGRRVETKQETHARELLAKYGFDEKVIEEMLDLCKQAVHTKRERVT